VYEGQYNYVHLYADQGPCYYPAGHVWLYYPIYHLFTKTELAEYFLIVAHILCSCTANLYAAKMAYAYFDHQTIGQLVAFMLAANTNVLWDEAQWQFNDSVMRTACLMGAYYLAVQSRVVLGSVLFAIGWSLKATCIMWLPSLFGIIQYRYGIRWLLISVFIIFSYQILVALPFTIDQGIDDGATTWQRYLQKTKMMGGDGRGGKMGWGAARHCSCYWTFLTAE